MSLAREPQTTDQQIIADVSRALFLLEFLLENKVYEYVVNHVGRDLDQ